MNSEVKKYYKYRPLRQGADPHPFTASIFEKRELWFSAPKEFNDPFDCNLRLHVNDSTDEEWISYIDLMIDQNPSMRPKLEITKNGKLWKVNPSMTAGIGEGTQELNYHKSSVFCLSKKPDSIPMFSYYADSHKGVAIEFSFSNLNVPCGVDYLSSVISRGGTRSGVVFNDVVYPESYPELNYHRLYDRPELLQNIIFAKHHEWRHEQEYRIFRRAIPASTVNFEHGLLTGVVFGCKSTVEDVDLVKGWLAGWPAPVTLSKTSVSSTSFSLEIEEFDRMGGVSH